jgi:hypothetical protein
MKRQATMTKLPFGQRDDAKELTNQNAKVIHCCCALSPINPDGVTLNTDPISQENSTLAGQRTPPQPHDG